MSGITVLLFRVIAGNGAQQGLPDGRLHLPICIDSLSFLVFADGGADTLEHARYIRLQRVAL